MATKRCCVAVVHVLNPVVLKLACLYKFLRGAESLLTSLVCSCMLLRGLALAGEATSHILMLPSPQEDTRMFSFSCQSACHLTHSHHMKSHTICPLTALTGKGPLGAAGRVCTGCAKTRERASDQAQSYMPSLVSNSVTSTSPLGVICSHKWSKVHKTLRLSQDK